MLTKTQAGKGFQQFNQETVLVNILSNYGTENLMIEEEELAWLHRKWDTCISELIEMATFAGKSYILYAENNNYRR